MTGREYMDILRHILELRERRGWTEWRLAEESNLQQSTISSWYQKGLIPKIPSLEKICRAFNISMSQFFAGEEDPVSLTEQQRELLANWNALSGKQRELLLELIKNIPTKNE
jgi:transcriptional regulator with XRE-family HTH domain